MIMKRVITFFILLHCSILFAQFTPFFYNIEFEDLVVGNQNWDITKLDNGKVYVANGNGLLEFDGLQWQLYQLPNKTTVRSVYGVGEKIYTGSYQEFGYWEPNELGLLTYHSVTENSDNLTFTSEEFWQITSIDDDIYFRSFSNVYKYDGNKIEQFNAESSVISINVIDKDLYVSTLDDGILKLSNNELVSVIQSEKLTGKKITSVNRINNDQILIATELNGCFLFKNNEIVEFQSEITPIIKKFQLNKFLLLENGNMLFGTIKNGVYYTNREGEIINHINKKNGLQNNTVLSLKTDTDNQLWLGLDNGLSFIDLDSDFQFFNDLDGNLGAVYDVVEYENKIYIGSNTGLYVLEKNGDLNFINGSQGQVWDLTIIGQDLFCGHNRGTFLVRNDQVQRISDFTGGWVIKKVPEKENTYIQGTYAGLVLYQKINGVWRTKHLGEPLIPIRYIEFHDSKTAWLAHSNQGLYKVVFNTAFDSIVDINRYKSKAFSDFKLKINKIKNELIIKSNDGWFKYEGLTDEILTNDYLNQIFGKESQIISKGDIGINILKKGQLLDFRDHSDLEKSMFKTDHYFSERTIVGESRISRLNDSIMVFNLNDGLMLIADKKLKTHNPQLLQPVIEQIMHDDNYLKLNSDNQYNIPFKHNSITINVSSPKSKNHVFEYTFLRENKIEDWQKIKGTQIRFNHLKEGENKVLIRTKNYLDTPSEPITLNLIIALPWYKTTQAFLLYIVSLILIVVLFYVLHKRKISKEQKLLKIKLQKEQEELIRKQEAENEKKIIQLKNESLRHEVKLKSKELANNAMALVKKNEILQDIKKELEYNKDGFGDYFTYKKLIKRIDSSIALKDEWKVFEHNFNQVHQDFFKTLKSKHPKLTSKDLKICAYIKMNFLTKEIAPLMNVSVRGIETHRYRLKKKLNLENDTSLMDYLLNIEK